MWKCWQQVGDVFLIRLIFYLLNLKQYLNSLQLFEFSYLQELLFGPAHRSAQTGLQAGAVPEQAGLRAGPNRVVGRATTRDCRPSGRPRPGVRPGHCPSQPAPRPAQAGSTAGARQRRGSDGRRWGTTAKTTQSKRERERMSKRTAHSPSLRGCSRR